MVDEARRKVIEESIARGSLENDDEEDTRVDGAIRAVVWLMA